MAEDGKELCMWIKKRKKVFTKNAYPDRQGQAVAILLESLLVLVVGYSVGLTNVVNFDGSLRPWKSNA